MGSKYVLKSKFAMNKDIHFFCLFMNNKVKQKYEDGFLTINLLFKFLYC